MVLDFAPHLPWRVHFGQVTRPQKKQVAGLLVDVPHSPQRGCCTFWSHAGSPNTGTSAISLLLVFQLVYLHLSILDALHTLLDVPLFTQVALDVAYHHAMP